MKRTGIIFCTLIFTLFISAFKQQSKYGIGDTVEDFKLKNINGKMVSLADYKDAKGFIIIFSCNHCPYVKAYEDRMIALNNKYASNGYPVIAINSNDAVSYPADSYENMVKRAEEKKFTFPYLFDESQEVAKKYGALKTPHVYILKKEKAGLKIAYVGAIDDNSESAEQVKVKYAENALEELLANKEVSVKETKAIGCGLKYKK